MYIKWDPWRNNGQSQALRQNQSLDQISCHVMKSKQQANPMSYPTKILTPVSKWGKMLRFTAINAPDNQIFGAPRPPLYMYRVSGLVNIQPNFLTNWRKWRYCKTAISDTLIHIKYLQLLLFYHWHIPHPLLSQEKEEPLFF